MPVFVCLVAEAGIAPASEGSFTLHISTKNGLYHDPIRDPPIIVSEPSVRRGRGLGC